MSYIERIVDVSSDEIVERPYTKAEIADVEAAKKLAAETATAAEAAMAKKAAILAALADATGYTADELREALNA